MTLLPWVTTVIFAIIAVNLYMMWRQGIKTSIDLTSLIVMILFDPKIYEKESAALFDFARKSTYASHGLLAGMASNLLCKIAAVSAPISGPSALRLLWTLNQDAPARRAEISN